MSDAHGDRWLTNTLQCSSFIIKKTQHMLKLLSHTQTHTQLFKSPLSRTTRVGWYQKKHSLTHTHPDHQTSFINFLHLLWNPPCSVYVFNSPFPQPLLRSSLVFLLVWDAILHTPYISLPSRHHLSATHSHTITACFAVVPRLCHLFLTSLSAPYLEICLLP